MKLRVQGLRLRVLRIRGAILGGPHNKDYNGLVSIFGVSHLGKLTFSAGRVGGGGGFLKFLVLVCLGSIMPILG